MDNGGEIRPVQLISGDGNFNDVGMDDFANKVKMNEWGISYSVISIMGPQSSGKSTLLNHLCGTKFRVMDADEGGNQTTQGIWLANGIGMERHTLVMDLEGTDGNERGEDDTAFESRSALFALAVSDVLLVNMWCTEVGRCRAGNIPLLRTVFEVMLQLSIPRKPTLMFVLRDQTKSPLEKLDRRLRQDIEKLWNSIHQDAPLTNFFNVEVEALISFELCEEQFEEQVANLRHKISNSIASGAHGGDQGAIDASSFSFSAREMWEQIKANNDLDLPALRVLVATVRCEEIANNMFTSFTENEKWSDLEMAARSDVILGFRNELTSIIDSCLSQYDEKTTYYDERIRLARRNDLEEKLLLHVRPTVESIIGHLRSEAFVKFKHAFDQALSGGQVFSVAAETCPTGVMSEFDIRCADVVIQQANWNTSKGKEKLGRKIAEYIGSVRDAKLSELTDKFKHELDKVLCRQVGELLKSPTDDTWHDIRQGLQCEILSAFVGLDCELSSFNVDFGMRNNVVSKLKEYARGVVISKASEEAENVSKYMDGRFTDIFFYDPDRKPRDWSGGEDIADIARSARFEALKCLFDMAVIRLDNEDSNVKRILSIDLVGETPFVVGKMASNGLKGVPSSSSKAIVLLSAPNCESLWTQFMADTEVVVNHAIDTKAIIVQGIAAQEAIEHNGFIVPAAAPNSGSNPSFAAVAPLNSGMSNVIPRALRFVAECLKALARRFPNFVLRLVENLLPSGSPVIRFIRQALIEVIKILQPLWPSYFSQLLMLLAPYEAEIWGANPEPQHAFYLAGNHV
ncbi:hypothetical protein Droror1_Dr00006304 [Drosera rotundifolia]